MKKKKTKISQEKENKKKNNNIKNLSKNKYLKKHSSKIKFRKIKKEKRNLVMIQ